MAVQFANAAGSDHRAMAAWLVNNGMPHLVADYRATDRWPLLAVPLFLVIAFELVFAPYHMTLTQILIVPPLLLILVAVTRGHPKTEPAEHDLGEGDEFSQEPEPSPAIFWLAYCSRWTLLDPGALGRSMRGLICIFALHWYLGKIDAPIGLDWKVIDGLVAFLALFGSGLLVFPGMRAISKRKAILQTVPITVAVIALSLHGTLFMVPGVDDRAGRAKLVPLAIVLASLAACWLVKPRKGTDIPSAESAVLIPAVSFLFLLLGCQVLLIPRLATASLEPLVAIGAFLLILAVALAAWVHVRSDEERRVRHWDMATRVLFGVWVAIFVIGFPVVAGTSLLLRLGSREVDGMMAGLIIFAINALYALVIWFTVAFGADRLVGWAWRSMWRNWRNLLGALAQGLPLLVVFVTFLTFTQEAWEVISKASMAAFLTLLTILLTCIILVTARTADDWIIQKGRFEARAVVEKEATRAMRTSRGLTELVESWKREPATDDDLDPRLKGLARINVITAMTLYQLMVLLFLAAVAATVLAVLSRLMVPAPVAAGWIYGDGADPASLNQNSGFLATPYMRVPVTLAVIAVLYVAVELLKDPERATEFFSHAEEAIRRRLAVYIVYRGLLPRDLPHPPLKPRPVYDLSKDVEANV